MEGWAKLRTEGVTSFTTDVRSTEKPWMSVVLMPAASSLLLNQPEKEKKQ